MILARRLFFCKSRSEVGSLDPGTPLYGGHVTPVYDAPNDRTRLTTHATAHTEDRCVNTKNALRGVLTSVPKRGLYSQFDFTNLSPRLVGDIG